MYLLDFKISDFACALFFVLCRKKLSMYASVTRVIPNIDDSLKTSGCILLL